MKTFPNYPVVSSVLSSIRRHYGVDDRYMNTMTETQFLLLIATIYVAPHANPTASRFVGIVIIIFASLKGLGVL